MYYRLRRLTACQQQILLELSSHDKQTTHEYNIICIAVGDTIIKRRGGGGGLESD
jgi:hypothetical protein